MSESKNGAKWWLGSDLWSHPLRVVLPLAVINSVLLIVLVGFIDAVDTWTYVDAITQVSHGDLDQYRTPVYPLFLWLCQGLFGQAYFILGTIALQHVCYWVSIVYFDRLLAALCSSRLARWVLLIVYALHPGFTMMLNCVLTEAFSVMGIVMLLWVSHRLLTTPRLRHGGYFFFWLTFLVFLRPSFSYLLPISLLLWGGMLLWRHGGIAVLTAFCATIVISLAMLGYMAAFEHRYHVRTITAVSTVNMYQCLIDTTAIEPPEMKADIMQTIHDNGMVTEPGFPFWVEMEQLLDHYGQERLQAVLDHSLKVNFKGYVKVVLGHVLHSSGILFLHYNNVPHDGPVSKMLYKLFPVYIITFYLLLLFYAALVCRQVWKTRRVPLISVVMSMLSLGLVLVSLLGAYGDWPRLFLPVAPCALLMVGQLCSMMTLRLKPRNERQLL